MSVKYIGPIKLAEPRHFFFLTEVDVQSHESKRMLGVSILPLVRFFFFDFGTVPTVCFFHFNEEFWNIICKQIPK